MNIDDAYVVDGELVAVGADAAMETCETLAAWADDHAELRYTYDPERGRPVVTVLLEGVSHDRAQELIPDDVWLEVSEVLV